MPNRLVGVDTKIERAKQYIAEFEVLHREWVDAHSHSVIDYCEIDSRNWVWLVDIGYDVPPILAAVAGDIVSNLRTALDYLMNALLGMPEEEVNFPIRRSAEGYKSQLTQIEGRISEAAMDIFKATEAYPGGNGQALWELHELNNRQKHRLLTPVVNAYNTFTVDFKDSSIRAVAQYGGGWIIRSAETLFPMKSSTIKFVVTERTWRVHMDMDPQFSICVAFGEDTVAEGQAVLPTLTEFADFVEGTVKPFRPLFT